MLRSMAGRPDRSQTAAVADKTVTPSRGAGQLSMPHLFMGKRTRPWAKFVHPHHPLICEARTMTTATMGKPDRTSAYDAAQVPEYMRQPSSARRPRNVTPALPALPQLVVDFSNPALYAARWTKAGPLSAFVTEPIRKRVMDRLERVATLSVRRLGADRYHVTDGHYLDLSGARGSVLCPCGDHENRDSVCKHLMAVLADRGWDAWRVRNVALTVEILNAAKRAAFASLYPKETA